MSKMRSISYNGNTYKWCVGKHYIAITCKALNLKILHPKEDYVRKYFVVYQHWDSTTGFSAQKFENADLAKAFLKKCRKNFGVMKESYMFSSTKFGSITPATIKRILEEEVPNGD